MVIFKAILRAYTVTPFRHFYFNFFGLFRSFDMDPKHQNEPKQTEKIYLLVSRNKPKMNRNRPNSCLFRFEPKNIFVCFEDTLLRAIHHWAESRLRAMHHFRSRVFLLMFCCTLNFKGTVSRDFRPSIFFIKLYPWVPWFMG
jgi:hypothetical protein